MLRIVSVSLWIRLKNKKGAGVSGAWTFLFEL